MDPLVLAIERRARDAGVKMTPVLVEAGVAPSTWWRWRQGRTHPLLDTLRLVETALDRRIGEKAAA